MSQTSGIERRVHPRHLLGRGVEFFHAPTRRHFPAFCRDISEGGMLMLIPASTPVRRGQSVRLQVSDLPVPGIADMAGRPLNATVLRVDRTPLTTDGQIAIAVRFSGAST